MKKFLSAVLMTTLLSVSAISFAGCTDITKSANYNSYELKYLVNLTNTEESAIADTVKSVQKSLTKRLNNFDVANVSIDTNEEDGKYYITMKFGTIDAIEEIKPALSQNRELILKKRITDESDYAAELKTRAEADLKDLLEYNADFDIIAQNGATEDPERIVYSEATDWMYKEEILGAFSDVVFGMEPGAISPELVEFETQPFALAEPIQVYSIVKLFDKRDKNYVKVSHILIPYAGALRSPEGETRTKEEAQILADDLTAQLNDGGDFATLAKENSSCSSAESGGVLDAPAGSGGYVAAFENAALALTEAEQITAQPVETEFGYHIIKADEIIPAQQAKFGVIFYALRAAEWEPVNFSADYVKNVNIKYDETYNPYLVIQFNSEGTEKLKTITEENTDSIIGVFSGMDLITSFTVKEVNESGTIKILSPEKTSDAEALREQLVNGKLAAPIILKDEQSVEK
ncbi:peptidylprolyl isomerase [Patescibacteria group bacterium]|nr:peptidylprolyl isomerase [Patescibacteria group bacterium]